MPQERNLKTFQAEIDWEHRIIDESGAIDVIYAAYLLLPGTEVVIHPGNYDEDIDVHEWAYVGLERRQKSKLLSSECTVGLYASVEDFDKERMRIHSSATRKIHDPQNKRISLAQDLRRFIPKVPNAKGGFPIKDDEFRTILKSAIVDLVPYFDNPDTALPQLHQIKD